jgi:histidinol-phosphate/aromatic aminotransferase/cobyric acid decarboxylase-like protein
LSNPSSADGNITNIPQDIPVVLDVAHIGSCSNEVKIDVPDNVEKVFFSLSKCFGLRNYRIGYYWSRTPDKQLERLIGSAKYYNYHSMQLGEMILNKVGPTYVNTWLKKYQDKLCDELDLVPSDSVWLATTTNEEYDKSYKS